MDRDRNIPQNYPYNQPPQYQSNAPYNPNYSQPSYNSYQTTSPRDNSIFFNFGNALFSSGLGSLLTYPFIRARSLLSIRPDTPGPERAQRYIFALRQIVNEQGVKTLLKGYSSYASMIPAFTIDLAFFYSLKSMTFSSRYFRESNIPWLGNALLASVATTMRYLMYQPFSDAYMRIRSYSSRLQWKDVGNEIIVNMRNRYQANGALGLYENLAKNLPTLVIFRAIQLGTCETVFQRAKYTEGHTSWAKKFILCYGISAFAKYIAYPFEVAREKAYTSEKELGKSFKNYLNTLKGVVAWLDKNSFRSATTKALQASGSTLALSIFFHITDVPKWNYA